MRSRDFIEKATVASGIFAIPMIIPTESEVKRVGKLHLATGL